MTSIFSELAPENIYNGDETAIYHKMTTKGSFCQNNEQTFGYEQKRGRLTVLFCSNLTGTDKLEPLVIRIFANPRCFKNKMVPCSYKSHG